MFSDLAAFRADLAVKFETLPIEGLRVEPTLEGTIKSLVPVVYVEFVAFDNTIGGQPVPFGRVAARCNVIITSPKTDTAKSESEVDDMIPHVIAAIDGDDQMYWERAEKKRLTDGPMAWALTLYAYVSLTPPATTTEP